jgi:pimeloyl-ACP methyl ester carboxylesterase
MLARRQRARNVITWFNVIYLFPGMGADRRMYPEPWDRLTPRNYIEWPSYVGETSIKGLAKRIIADQDFKADDLLVGSSLGGIVACEIANITPVRGLVLVGSAKSKGEISRLVSLIHPLIDLTPLRFAQRLAASVPGDLAQMFTQADATFIRATCKAIFDWEGLHDGCAKVLRIHGEWDHVIPLPEGVDYVLHGGHLIAMTHAQECVDIIARERADQITLHK